MYTLMFILETFVELIKSLCFSFTGDTIDRLSMLHELLAEVADWPRVVQCAQTVPVLLHIFFNTVITVETLYSLLQLYIKMPFSFRL